MENKYKFFFSCLLFVVVEYKTRIEALEQAVPFQQFSRCYLFFVRRKCTIVDKNQFFCVAGSSSSIFP